MATDVPHRVHHLTSSQPGESPQTPLPPSYMPSTPPDGEPGPARSAVPVVVSVGMLFGLAVAAAFVGRGLVEMLTSLVGGG
jgi:hypothetical protein